MSPRPTFEAVREYLKVPATVLSDDDLARMMGTADAEQRARCTMDEDPEIIPDALNQTYLRRVQREVAAKNLPLGMVGIDAEYGPQRVPYLDALVEENERPYRMQVVG